MALGERLYGEHKDFNGREWRISIMQEGWASAAAQLTLVDPPFSIEWANSGDEIITPIKASTCSISFYNMGDDEATLIEDMVLAAEQTFFIKIEIAGSPNTLHWAGIVTQDLISHSDTYRDIITIEATDGLGRLKDVPYPATSYDEFETCYAQLVDILSINNTDQFWSGTDAFITSNVNWYENQMYTTSPANTLEPLIKTRLRTDVFYKEEPAETSGDGQRPEPETISAYDALTNILTIFGARLHLELGRWWVMQPSEYNDSSCITRNIRKDATVIAASTFEHTVAANQTTVIRANISYDYLPAFKQVNILHNVRSNKLFPGNKGFRTANYPDYDVIYTIPPIQGNNDSTFKIIYQLNNYTTLGGPAFTTFDIEVEIDFRCNDGITTYYLRRSPQTGKAEWSTTAGTLKVYVRDQKGDNIVTGEVLLPTPPWNYATTNTLELTFIPVFWNGTLRTVLPIQLNYGVWLNVVVLPNGQDESDIFYKATNDTYSTQSVVFEIPEVLIGDQSTRSQINGVEVQDTTNAWKTSANWKIGNTGTAQRLLGLLCQTTLGMQKLPVQRITGDIHLRSTASYSFANTLNINGVRFIPISLTYTPGNAEVKYSGEWVAIGVVTTGITVGNSIKNFQLNADVIKVVGNLQRQLTALGDVLQNFMDESRVMAWTSDEVSGNSVTTIDVVGLVSPVFKSGDVLKIVSKEDVSITEEITINANPTNGDSTITIVSKNFTNTYPAGSWIMPKRNSIIADDVFIDGVLRLDNVPTSDPAIAGVVYSDIGTLKISGG